MCNVFDWMILSNCQIRMKIQNSKAILNLVLNCSEMKVRKVKSGWHPNFILQQCYRSNLASLTHSCPSRPKEYNYLNFHNKCLPVYK